MQRTGHSKLRILHTASQWTQDSEILFTSTDVFLKGKSYAWLKACIFRASYLPAAVLRVEWNHGAHKLYLGYTG